MKTAGGTAHLSPVSDHGGETRGEAIIRRRKELGSISQHGFAKWMAEQADLIDMPIKHVRRETLINAEKDDPGVEDETYDRINWWLDRFERATEGMENVAEEPDQGHFVTFQLSGNFGVDVTVKGPVENLAELEAAVEKLLRGMRDSNQ